MALKTEQNTPAVERAIRRAARCSLRLRHITTVFEHGQWWVTDRISGAQWSVVDAEGHGAINGFGFELITDGEGP